MLQIMLLNDYIHTILKFDDFCGSKFGDQGFMINAWNLLHVVGEVFIKLIKFVYLLFIDQWEYRLL
jgi:hypothetical protein